MLNHPQANNVNPRLEKRPELPLEENVLSSIDAIVHEQQVNVGHIPDDEGLVTRGHHVAGLLVRAEADL